MITISAFIWLAGYERYMYLPSAGFCIIISQYFFKVYNKKAIYKYPLIFFVILFFVYNIYSLEQKQNNWIIASGMSFNTVNQIIKLTSDIPTGSEVYFRNLPGDYKGAWVIRNEIPEIYELFVKRRDIKFYNINEMSGTNLTGKKRFIYDCTQNEIIPQN